MVDINHEIDIQAPVKKVFDAITTIDGLKSWHTEEVQGDNHVNGILTFKSKDKPTFGWKIVDLKPYKLTWECVEGPGDSVGTKVIYTLSNSKKENHTLLEFSHQFWPNDQGNFRKCNTLWAVLLHHLKKYVETGKKEPAVS